MSKAVRAALLACLFTTVAAAHGQAGSKVSAGVKRNNLATHAATAAPDPHDVVEKEILNELRQIRVLLEQQQQRGQQAAKAAVAAPTQAAAVEQARVSTTGFALGSKNAPITIVEFADYQCPFCRQFHNTVFAQLKKDYIDTGKVRFVSRDLPLDFHPNAFSAAEAARCAGEQNKYWEMRDTLIAHADNLAPEAIIAYSTQLGIDPALFHGCIESHAFSTSIRADANAANAAGITGTPSFVVGPTTGQDVQGEKVIGALPYDSFAKILSQYLTRP